MKKNYYIFIQMFLFVSLTCFQVNAQQIKPERNKTEKVGTPEATKFQVPQTRATMLGTLCPIPTTLTVMKSVQFPKDGYVQAKKTLLPSLHSMAGKKYIPSQTV